MVSVYPGENGDKNSSYHRAGERWKEMILRALCIVLVLNNITVSTQHVITIWHFKHFQWPNPVAGELIHWFPISWKGRLKALTTSVACDAATMNGLILLFPTTLSLQPPGYLWKLPARSLLPLLPQHSSFSSGARVTSYKQKSCHVHYSAAQKFPAAPHLRWTKAKLFTVA